MLTYLNKHKKLFLLIKSVLVHRSIFFNNKLVQQVSLQKHLGPILDTSSTFHELIKANNVKLEKL